MPLQERLRWMTAQARALGSVLHRWQKSIAKAKWPIPLFPASFRV